MSLENKVSSFSKGLVSLAAGAALSYSPADAAVSINLTGTAKLNVTTSLEYLELKATNTSPMGNGKISKLLFPHIYADNDISGNYSGVNQTIVLPSNWTATITPSIGATNTYDILVTSTRSGSNIGEGTYKEFQLYGITSIGTNLSQLMWSTDAAGLGNIGTAYEASGSTVTDTFAAPIAVPETNSIGYLIAGLGVLGLMRKRN